jgi:glycosyltransferase involved in cell wall biosynthesis
VRILVVSGIWPPDVGGPASHAPEAAAALRARGHELAVVTTASEPPPAEAFPVHWVSRRLPPGVRHAAVAAEVARRSAHADVVYATSMVGRSAFAARAPLVVKVAGDPAFERARRRGWFDGTLDEFQHARSPVLAALRTARTLALRRAAHVVCPSAYLRDLVIAWGIPETRVSVLANPVPGTVKATVSGTVKAADTFVFAGRLNAQKSVGTAIEALAHVDGASLVVAGDGPERAALERRARELGLNGRVRFVGSQPRERVLELFAEAEAALLPSA